MSDLTSKAKTLIREILDNFVDDVISELEDLKNADDPEFNDGIQTAQNLVWDLKKDYEQ